MALWTPAKLSGAIWWDAEAYDKLHPYYSSPEGYEPITSWDSSHPLGYSLTLESSDPEEVNAAAEICLDGEFPGIYQYDYGYLDIYSGNFLSSTDTITLIFIADWWEQNSVLLSDGATALISAVYGNAEDAATNGHGVFYINGTAVDSDITQGELFSEFYSNGALLCVTVSSLSGITSPRIFTDIDAHYGDIIILDHTPTADERQKCEGFLANKANYTGWLKSDHPYKASPPEISTVFSVAFAQEITDTPTPGYAFVQMVTDSPLPETTLIQLVSEVRVVESFFAQLFSLEIGKAFVQTLGDATIYKTALSQYLGDYPKLATALKQIIGNNEEFKAALSQPFTIRKGLQYQLKQLFTIAEKELETTLSQPLSLPGRDTLISSLEQIFSFNADGSQAQRIEVDITCDGEVIDLKDITQVFLERDKDAYYNNGELQTLSQDIALKFVKDTSEVSITTVGETFNFVPGITTKTTAMAGDPPQLSEIWVVPLYSKTKLLDAPYANQVEVELYGMASTVVKSLVGEIPLQWNIVDWYIDEDIIDSIGEFPIDIIRDIVEAAGGIIQTAPDGTLVISEEYPVSPGDWSDAEAEYTFTDQIDISQIVDSADERDGYNIFYISNVDDTDSDDSGITIETEATSSTVANVTVSVVPWNDECNLHHSGGDWVSIISNGIVTETITEQIEIVAGEGSLENPFYVLESSTWKQQDLGEIEIDESGNVTTEIEGNSLLNITYTTKYHSFSATDLTAEDVQFYPEII